MAFLLKSVLGSSAPEEEETQENIAETVENFVERIETSTLLEDRRDACRGLKSLSKTYQLQVGAQGMDALFFVLQNDSDDPEIVELALEAFNNIICNEEANQDLCVQFTEIFIKKNENVQLILDLLPEFEFKIRLPVIRLLNGLLKNKLRKCQDCILTHPMGIPRMMDLLVDPREVIRNEALLLLVFLTKNNANIQKIVAFENAFDRILEVISCESFSDGGIVVEDCLTILLNLLSGNTSNQNYFKEGNYLQRLIPFFDIPFDVSWSAEKISNILLMFKVIRSLVSPSNPLQVTNSCQTLMNQNGILQKLCVILLSSSIPGQVLTETVNCIAEVIRGNQQNQEYFSRVNAPVEPPRPVLVILLMSMINEKQPFDLRSAVLYCFQSFLFKNELGQSQIVETLLPSGTDTATGITAGQLLCNGLFVNYPLTNWFVSIALSHVVVRNLTQKEQLLRVQLAIDSSGLTTSLLGYICLSLRKPDCAIQKKISSLMMLSMWLSDSPLAVANFLAIPQNVPFLTAQVGVLECEEPIEKVVQGLCAFLLGTCICFNDNSVPSLTKDDLCKLIQNRIGVDIFSEKLESISKHEKYNQALQRPQMSYTDKADVLFDYTFCNLFKSQEPTILRIVQKSTNGSASNAAGGANENSLNSEEHKLLLEYKELIRKQDTQLVTMGKQLSALQNENHLITAQLNESRALVQQLQDQLALIRSQSYQYAAMLQHQQQYQQQQLEQSQLYQQQQQHQSYLQQQQLSNPQLQQHSRLQQQPQYVDYAYSHHSGTPNVPQTGVMNETSANNSTPQAEIVHAVEKLSEDANNLPVSSSSGDLLTSTFSNLNLIDSLPQKPNGLDLNIPAGETPILEANHGLGNVTFDPLNCDYQQTETGSVSKLSFIYNPTTSTLPTE